MTEYKTFDDYVKNIFKIEPTEITHISPEEQKKKILKITADELINIWNESTKLKIDYEVLNCSVGDFGELQDKLEEEQRKNNGLSDNLTKAKEHIENLLYYVKQCSCERSNYAELEHDIAEAEQFLKDIEVEK